MDKALIIQAEPRHEVSKKLNKALRRAKKMPAIIYGGQDEALPIAITQDDMKRIFKSEKKENTLLSIQREGHSVDAMLKDIQHNPLTDTIVHVDFLRVDVNKPVNVNVPIRVTGESYGVKNEDGFFEFINREVRIQCLPSAIPKEVVLDITDLHTGDSVKYADLKLDEGIRSVSDPHMIVCMIAGKGVEGEEAGEEAGEAAETTESTATPEA